MLSAEHSGRRENGNLAICAERREPRGVCVASSNGRRNLVFSPLSQPSTRILLRSFTSETKNHLVVSRRLPPLGEAFCA